MEKKGFSKKFVNLLGKFSIAKDGIIFHKTNSKFLFIVFGGAANKVAGERPLVFINYLKNAGCDVIFLRDFEKSWYHLGVNTVGGNIDEVAEFLKKTANEYETVITWGNSMGGYASILFSSLINADMCFSFVPQTFIDEKNRKIFGDRDNKQKSKICSISTTPQYFDLKNYLQTKITNQEKTKFYVFYGTKSRLDKIHTERMKVLNSFYIFGIEGSDHLAAQTLKKMGFIENLINKITESKNSTTITDFLRTKNFLNELQN